MKSFGLLGHESTKEYSNLPKDVRDAFEKKHDEKVKEYKAVSFCFVWSSNPRPGYNYFFGGANLLRGYDYFQVSSYNESYAHRYFGPVNDPRKFDAEGKPIPLERDYVLVPSHNSKGLERKYIPEFVYPSPEFVYVFPSEIARPESERAKAKTWYYVKYPVDVCGDVVVGAAMGFAWVCAIITGNH